MKKRKKKKKSVGKIIGIVVGCMVAAIAVFLLSCYLIMLHYINKRNYVPTTENFTILAETPSFLEDVLNPSTEEPGTDSDKEEVESYKNEVESNAESIADADEELVSDVYNILLIGSDIRPEDLVGRSDTMILVSINKQTKRIVATSFLRDTYVKIPIMNEFHK
ncbi:MAG: LCP family protein, partial [Lachnospiraceae bacterium]